MENLEKKLLNKLLNHLNLNEIEAKDLMNIFLSEKFNPFLSASILSLLNFKGESIEELCGFCSALKENMIKFEHKNENIIDIIETGINTKKTFNISLLSSFIISNFNTKIAKQINNFSDLENNYFLKTFEINMDINEKQKQQCLEEENLVFLNTSTHHPNIQNIKNLETNLGIYSIISIIQPICNPANINKIMIGTTDRISAKLYLDFLQKSNHINKAYIYWNEAGYNKLVPIGTTRLFVFEKGQNKRELILTATDFALAGNYKVGTHIFEDSIEDNKKVIEEINSGTNGITMDTIIMNSVLALKLSGRIESLKEGTEIIKAEIKNGLLKKKIESIKNITNKFNT